MQEVENASRLVVVDENEGNVLISCFFVLFWWGGGGGAKIIKCARAIGEHCVRVSDDFYTNDIYSRWGSYVTIIIYPSY